MQPPDHDYHDRHSGGGLSPPNHDHRNRYNKGDHPPDQDHRDHRDRTLTPSRDHRDRRRDGRGVVSPGRDHNDSTLSPRPDHWDHGFNGAGVSSLNHNHRDRTLTPSRDHRDQRFDDRGMASPAHDHRNRQHDDRDHRLPAYASGAPHTDHDNVGRCQNAGALPPPDHDHSSDGANCGGMLSPGQNHNGRASLQADQGHRDQDRGMPNHDHQGHLNHQDHCHHGRGKSGQGVPPLNHDQNDRGPMVWRRDSGGSTPRSGVSAADDAAMRRLCLDNYGRCNVNADADHPSAPRASDAGQLQATGVAARRPVAETASEIWEAIDLRGAGSISKLELCMAVQRDSAVSQFVLPGFGSSNIMDDEVSFNAVDALFEAIGNRQHRINKAEFVSYFNGSGNTSSDLHALLPLFKKLDADGNGSVSKFEFVNAVQRDPTIASLVLPGIDNSCVTSNVELFDTINDVFDDIAGGKKCFDFLDFRTHIQATPQPLPHHDEDRSTRRVLIIGPGFGLELNPRQGDLVMRAGFQVRWVVNVPNPEQPGFPMMQYLPLIKAAIDEFQPHLVACASKGGHYMIALWQTGLWKGPSLMINAHPGLRELPADVPIVLAVGSNDEFYVRSRADLEQLISTGTRNRCFLYYAGSSGPIQGGFARIGDRHNMDSLLTYDCLPCLMDAALCHKGPESHMIWSWRQRLSPDRLEAEQWLSYCPDQLRRRWVSAHHKGLDDQKLFEVPKNSKEFQMVTTMFRAAPTEPAAYGAPNPAWDRAAVLRVQRVENGLQEDGSAKPYYAALRKSIEDQGITFEPGVHTRWAFHGTDAIDSIVNDPLSGFQPLASGARLGSVWGSGSYFARDAKYVLDGNFCQQAADGTRQMLMCLVMIGIPCLGGVEQKGVLPFREKPHRYNSAVDSLSNPEIFIVQHPSAAYPAYLITFA